MGKYLELCQWCGWLDDTNYLATYYELDSKCQLHTHSIISSNTPIDEADFRLWKNDLYPKYQCYSTNLKTTQEVDWWFTYIKKQDQEWVKTVYTSLTNYKKNRKLKLNEAIIISYRPKRFNLNPLKVKGVYLSNLPTFLD